MTIRRVLVVCSGNTCRSPMAAAYLQQALAEAGVSAVEVASAGLHAVPGLPAAAEAREAVARHGLSLAAHRSRPLTGDLLAGADLVLTMTRSQAEELRRRFPEAAARVVLWREWAAGTSLPDADVPDPFGQGLADYQVLARQLRREAAIAARRLAAGGESASAPQAASGTPTDGSQATAAASREASGATLGGTEAATGAPQAASRARPGALSGGLEITAGAPQAAAGGEHGQGPKDGELREGRAMNETAGARDTAGRPLRVAIGSDHAGFDLKGDLIAFMEERGIQVIDVGTHQRDSCDYPDYARAACLKVLEGEADRAVLICGTGIGMAIAANKLPGIRAACCTEPYSARLTRQDNDSNVLTLGARVVGAGMAREILATWLDTPFAGGRHQRRLDKIASLERESMKQRSGA